MTNPLATSPLITTAADPHHVLSPWIGQRSATFRFELIDGVSGQFLGELHPIRDASLNHDTTRTVKRSLQLNLGEADSAAINPVTDRVDVYMIFNQETVHEHPLGRYVFVDNSNEVFTGSRRLAHSSLADEMFIIDQAITAGITGNGDPVSTVVTRVLEDAETSVDFELAATPYSTNESWGIGIGRGQVLEALALTGDYFSPWFGNDKRMHFIRAFDPIKSVPDFDFDSGNTVFRNSVSEMSDVLTAPNRFVVISNAAADSTTPAVGIADVPVTAPHSVTNRGFVIATVLNLQVLDSLQAQATAENLALRQTIAERVSLVTVPDPRHDSYNVIRWQGQLWLELGWNMALYEGGQMEHLLRKAYR